AVGIDLAESDAQVRVGHLCIQVVHQYPELAQVDASVAVVIDRFKILAQLLEPFRRYLRRTHGNLLRLTPGPVWTAASRGASRPVLPAASTPGRHCRHARRNRRHGRPLPPSAVISRSNG